MKPYLRPASSLITLLLAGWIALVVAGPAYSLGLGDIQYTNVLGEPLTAAVPVLDAGGEYSEDEVQVKVVGRQRALSLGYDHLSASRLLKVEVTRRAGGIWVMIDSGGHSVTEPFFNFQLELLWADGATIREYTLLMDPPDLASRRGPLSLPGDTRKTTPKTLAESVPQPAAAVAATDSRSSGASSSGEQIRVRPGDSLSVIARRVAASKDVSVADLQDWLFVNNPSAFIGGNPNRIMAGARLKLPGSGSDLSAAVAVATQSASAKPEPVAAVLEESAPDEPKIQAAVAAAVVEDSASQEGMLRLTKEKLELQEEVPSFAELEKQPEAVVKAYLDQTREKIDVVRRDNDELRRQIEKIEDSEYLQNLKGMVELQRQQLAELKKELVENRAAQSRAGTGTASRVNPDWEEKRSTPDVAVDRPSDSAILSLSGTTPENPVEQRSTWKQWTVLGLLLLAVVLLALIGWEVWRQKSRSFRTQEKPVKEAPIVVSAVGAAAASVADPRNTEDDLDLEDFDIHPEDLAHLPDAEDPFYGEELDADDQEKPIAEQKSDSAPRAPTVDEDWDDLFDAIVSQDRSKGESDTFIVDLDDSEEPKPRDS